MFRLGFESVGFQWKRQSICEMFCFCYKMRNFNREESQTIRKLSFKQVKLFESKKLISQEVDEYLFVSICTNFTLNFDRLGT